MRHPPGPTRLPMDLPPAATRRLFVGLLPDARAQAAIATWRTGWCWAGRPSLPPVERLHITLFFLGEVPAQREPALHAALAATPMEPLSLVLRTPAVWRGGVAVLLPDTHTGLLALHERMSRALQGTGFPVAGRGWQPHLTLARKASGARPPARPAAFACELREFALVWSQLPPQVPTARYQVVARYAATG